MRSVNAAITIAFLALSAAATQAEGAFCGLPSFRPAGSYDEQRSTIHLFADDLNQDNRIDLFGFDGISPSHSVFVRLGSGDGTFGPAARFPVRGFANNALVADFNQDGHVDMATVWLTVIEVKLGDGAGGFGPSHQQETAVEMVALAAGDFTSDGFPDLVAIRPGSTRLLVLPGNGTGSFGAAMLASPPLDYEAARVLVSDVNGDTRNDVIVQTSDLFGLSGSVAVLLGMGNGQFVVSAAVSGALRLGAVGDFTNDGRLDVLVSMPRPVFGAVEDVMRLYPGDGAGRLESPLTFTTPLLEVSEAADMNADGALDLVVALHVSNVDGNAAGGVMVGNGTGHFGPLIAFHKNQEYARPAAIEDFDADGRADIATLMGDGVTVFLSTCGNTADLEVSISESADPVVSPGTLTYTIQVTNHGPDIAAVNVDVTFDARITSSSEPPVCAFTTGTMRCRGIVLTGNEPGNTLTVTVRVVTATDPIAVRATVSTSVLDPDPGNDSADETTQVVVVGGSSFRIARAPGGGVALTWSSDGAQAGFSVVRFSGGAMTTFPSGGTLPAHTSSFVDPSPVADTFNCYTVVPVDSAGIPFGRSTLLCVRTNTVAATGAPAFTLGLMRDVAEVTWTAPAGGLVAIYVHPLDGSPVWNVLPREPSGVTTFATRGVNTCYVLYGYVFSPPAPPAVTGNSDVLCAVPNFATIE